MGIELNQVKVFDSDYRQLFATAALVTASFTPNARLMSHPLEDGSSIIDHRIILPLEIMLNITLYNDVSDIYNEIYQVFSASNKSLIVQSKVKTFTNLFIESLPHEENPEMFTAISINLKLREAKIVPAAKFGRLPIQSVKKPSDASKEKRGEVQAKEPSESEKKRGSSILADKLGIGQ